VLCSSQDHLKTRTRDLDHPILVGAENTDSWCTRKRDLQHTFSLDILIVTSPKVSFVTNGINLTGAGLAPGETIQFSYLEFTADRLGHLSLYPKERDSAAIFIGVVHSGSPSLHTTLEDSSDKDGAASSTVGSSRSPGP
jgi:hypothetical protein